MQANRRLSEVFPLRFRNGEQIRQFSKPCIGCGKMLTAQHMQGVVQLLDDQIAIAARAQCPACGARFSVTCLIDEEKRVRRVVLPYWLFNPYLRAMRPSSEAPKSSEFEMNAELPRPRLRAEESQPMPEPMLSVDVVRATESVGRYQDKPIPAWVRINGKEFAFDRIAAEDARTKEGEFLLDGYLVYRVQ